MNAPILVTGVSQRLGLATAKHLLSNDTPVIGLYRTYRPAIKELEGLGAKLYQVDFYDSHQLFAVTKQIKSDTPALRAIIHNASDWHRDCENQHYQILQKMLEVHALAPYHLSLELAPLLKSSGGLTDIIHISDAKTNTGSAKHSAYLASKSAQENLTKSLALKLAPNIKVNTIAPALILFNEDDGEDYRDQALKKSLIPREGGMVEYIKAIDYLLSSDYVTGTTLTLNGGRHLLGN